ncbi:hypothetical protein [Spirillospora sp. CA-128828]|uniref:hypothetical protein n=1 Tax=Spirillospora sp. CA-128828 TaxID=3240033 RepID=UPI003D92F9E8
MRKMTTLGAIAIAGAGLATTAGLAAPAMAAGAVTPDPAHRGENVTVKIPAVCKASPGTVTSPAFTATVNFAAGATTVPAQISSTAALTTHPVIIQCGNSAAKESVTVTAGKPPPPGGGAKTGAGGAMKHASPAFLGAGVALLLGAGGTMVIRRRRGDDRS